MRQQGHGASLLRALDRPSTRHSWWKTCRQSWLLDQTITSSTLYGSKHIAQQFGHVRSFSSFGIFSWIISSVILAASSSSWPISPSLVKVGLSMSSLCGFFVKFSVVSFLDCSLIKRQFNCIVETKFSFEIRCKPHMVEHDHLWLLQIIWYSPFGGFPTQRICSGAVCVALVRRAW
jgi:hypothetical protein